MNYFVKWFLAIFTLSPLTLLLTEFVGFEPLAPAVSLAWLMVVTVAAFGKEGR